MSPVTYPGLTQRSEGVLDGFEPSRLRDAAAFVCGVGGVGGAAAESLARAGVGTLGIADREVEPTKLDLPFLAPAPTPGRSEIEAAEEALLRIAPGLRVRTWGADWTDRLGQILPAYDVVVNGMDDPRASLRLHRAARRHGVAVVDSFVSPHPSVCVVRRGDPRPEEWLGFPTVSTPPQAIPDSDLSTALLHELSYVAAVSRGIERMPARLIGEILRGERPRSSFAPVALISGNLMAMEAIGVLLDRPSRTDYRGWFLDPWTGRVERPGPAPLVALRRWSALRRLASLAGSGHRRTDTRSARLLHLRAPTHTEVPAWW